MEIAASVIIDFATLGTSVACSLIVGIGSSYLTFLLQFTRFKAMDERREQDWKAWRDRVDNSISDLQKGASVTELALLTQRMNDLAKNVEKLWVYATELKHVVVDPYVLETGKLKQRLDDFERHR